MSDKHTSATSTIYMYKGISKKIIAQEFFLSAIVFCFGYLIMVVLLAITATQ